MNNTSNPAPVASYKKAEYEQAIVNSALWAAAGDALGWMTELSRGASGVEHRTGTRIVAEPIAWKRLIGGRSGVTVDLPAGTYSDDTQLRLCVSRSIRANGAFDVEAFAKVEITTWQGYCLGAGIGSKAAAANLSKRGVNWFSNFFATDQQKYVTAGGNGAAMRIQPHVWSAQGTLDDMVRRVMRDSVVTHGHPHGFCGAVFHALCLWETLASRRVPTLEMAKKFAAYMERLPHILENDNELTSFWRPNWEREAGRSLEEAIQIFKEDALRDIEIVQKVFESSSNPDYYDVLNGLGCLTDRYRGSGFKTSLAALALSLIYSPEKVADALVRSANELESDTDTIATMAGAILGALVERQPNWTIQDSEYLRVEAKRMARIAQRENTSSFSYPDISGWEPPTNQSDAVVIWNGSLALSGIGKLEPKSHEYKVGNSIWQWFSLPFGQSVLAKRRTNLKVSVNDSQMPRSAVSPKLEGKSLRNDRKQDKFEFLEQKEREGARREIEDIKVKPYVERYPGLDKATDIIIASGFDSTTIGRLINLSIDETGGIEAAVSLSAIIAKARLVRMRKK